MRGPDLAAAAAVPVAPGAGVPAALYVTWLGMHKVLGRSLRGVGLTLPQYFVLQTLEQHASMSVTHIGAALQLDSGTLSPLLKRMERAGLLARIRNLADERCLQVALTMHGATILKEATGIVEPIIQDRGHGGLLASLGALRKMLLALP